MFGLFDNDNKEYDYKRLRRDLEDEFGITIAAKYITKDNFATVDSICALVESLQ